MSAVRAFAHEVGGIAWGNRWWLTWNSLLAALPALLAVALFRRRGRWGPIRWVGTVAFVLLLPNAPYVVTDLVHLRGDVAQASRDATVYAGILPMYAVFIAWGLGCYAASLHEVGAWLRRTGRAAWVGRVEIGLHALCAVGILLGRVSRLNSWDTVTQPEQTMARALDTLTWRASPIVLVLLFFVVGLTHAATRVLVTAATTWVTGRVRPGRRSATV